MEAAALAILLVSAVFHATAQALIKGARDTLIFAWLMLVFSCVAGFPLFVSRGAIDYSGWVFVAVSGALEALYYTVLTKAYSVGDFSTVYPISRGSAPLFVLLWATIFLAESPSPTGLFGIFLVGIGMYFVNLPGLAAWRRPFRRDGTGAALWALATGLVISLYTTVDMAGVRRFDPIVYLYLVFVVAALAMAPVVLRKDKRGALFAEVTRSDTKTGRRRLDPPALFRVALCSALAFAAYVLVLAALRLSPVSYVAPVREISVVFGAWIGVRRFGERGGKLRIASAIVVAAGVAVIALS